MTGIDRWLIERVFEPAAWALTRWCGIGHLTVARGLVTAWAAAFVTYAIAAPTFWTMLGIVGVATATLCRFRGLARIEQALGTKGAANPEKHIPFCRGMRLVLLTFNCVSALLVVITVSVRPLEIGNMCFALHAYLAACDWPPPVEQAQPDGPHVVPEGA